MELYEAIRTIQGVIGCSGLMKIRRHASPRRPEIASMTFDPELAGLARFHQFLSDFFPLVFIVTRLLACL